MVKIIFPKKVNSLGPIIRRKCLLYDVIEGPMTEFKEVERRKLQHHGNLRKRRNYRK